MPDPTWTQCSVCHRVIGLDLIDNLERCPDCVDLEPGSLDRDVEMTAVLNDDEAEAAEQLG